MEISVRKLDRLSFRFAPWSWPFAENRKLEIERFFDAERELNPSLWNGRLLLLRDVLVGDGVMTGNWFETDYASMIAALAWDAMGESVKACFAAAAVISDDDAFIVGEMARHTRNAGQMLFPSGSVEPGDIIGDQVNFDGALSRELTEETGIMPEALVPAHGWWAVGVGPLLPLIKIMRASENAEDLRQRIVSNLASQPRPEFHVIRLVRRRSDLSHQMPVWMTAFLTEFWRSDTM